MGEWLSPLAGQLQQVGEAALPGLRVGPGVLGHADPGCLSGLLDDPELVDGERPDPDADVGAQAARTGRVVERPDLEDRNLLDLL